MMLRFLTRYDYIQHTLHKPVHSKVFSLLDYYPIREIKITNLYNMKNIKIDRKLHTEIRKKSGQNDLIGSASGPPLRLSKTITLRP